MSASHFFFAVYEMADRGNEIGLLGENRRKAIGIAGFEGGDALFNHGVDGLFIGGLGTKVGAAGGEALARMSHGFVHLSQGRRKGPGNGLIAALILFCYLWGRSRTSTRCASQHFSEPTNSTMQKILFLSAILMAVTTGMQAANYKGNPPEVVVAAFQQKFQGATDVDWEQEKSGDWEAEFEQNGEEISASFSAAGQWLETESEIEVAELPAAVRTALTGKKIKEAAKIIRANGMTVYEAEVKRKTILFDDQGKIMTTPGDDD